MLIVFYLNGQKHIGRIPIDIYYSEIFSVFRDHLVPLSTIEYEALQADEKKFIENFEKVQ